MSSIYKLKSVTIDFSDLIIQYPNNVVVELSLSESRILKLMIENPGVIYTNEELERSGWQGRPVSVSSLTVVISSLRKKIELIEGIKIKNKPRQGYLLQTDLNIERKEVQDSNKFRMKKSNLKIHFFIYIILMLILISTIVFFKPRSHLSCITIEDKSLCSVGVRDFNVLSVLDNINKGEIILKSDGNTIILDRFKRVKMSFKHD
ncbi:helix-turn-helix domain-containing protein [Aliivibrio fischeri]|uniref:OmpR/PhoB-type domain-containing protein n=1 Tax=Aliivibrio fischeri TaxID=668 RepID=A0A510UMS0_ALIFS|nr:helix-turn-helix domain-containing protein [Aliivibrio fischeri]MUK28740.1 helix-turn-helix domain-containing protein [Aliivibrio fischeri]GEK15973.1 hypothetical protein AFI02nite_40090 [Aliivibrio fischeri]